MITKHRTTEFIADEQGFTLVELLCAVAVGVLAAALIALAVRLAVDSWSTESELSQAIMACDTLATALQDELSYARDIEGDGSDFDFISGGRASGQRCRLDSSDEGLPGLSVTEGERFLPFIDTSALPRQLRANVMASWMPENGRFEVFISIRSPDGEELASADFCVEPYNFSDK